MQQKQLTNSDSLVFAIPNRKDWEPGFQALCKLLSTKLKRSVKLTVAANFEEVQNLICNHQAAFGIFTSTIYVKTKEVYPELRYLATGQTVENGQARSFYPGLFVTKRGSQYQSLSDLKGKPFAFVSQSSSSGYKYPVAFLHSHAVDPKKYFGNLMFLGDHPYVTDAIASDIVAGGVTWDVSLSKAVEKHGDIFQIIGKYGPIVNHALAAGSWVEPSNCEAVLEVLTNLPEQVTGIKGFPYSGFEVLSDSAYDTAREVENVDRLAAGDRFIQRSLSVAEFQSESLQEVLNLFQKIRLREESKLTDKFIKREPTPLLTHQTISELAESVRKKLFSMVESFPRLDKLANDLREPLNTLYSRKSKSSELLEAFQSILKIANEWLGISILEESEEFFVTAEQDRIVYKAKLASLYKQPKLETALEDKIEETKFLAAVTSFNERRREEKRASTYQEETSICSAYKLLKNGATIRSPYQSLGVSGFRPIHTYLFNTNPGAGHIEVTCQSLDLMNGATVHIEHIDRDKEFDKEKVEPYRMPAIINAAKVRLHVGSHAPCTCYIGRPVFESDVFSLDLLKSTHRIASACTAMFMNGIADCKIGMERMTTTETIKFMRCVVGNVIRDPKHQYLAAAFNINTPLIDDRPEILEEYGAPISITDPIEIARIAIEITAQGRFERITWDGASNEVPSIPIIGQLSHEHLTMLVHEAHKKGLQTYISAGLEPKHMRDAVFTGVDGVGMGTSLHYIDPNTKLMGALKLESIRQALQIRDEAEVSIAGKAAILLSRLDRLYFENLLQEEDEPLWLKLYEAILARNTHQTEKLMDKFNHILSLPFRTGLA